jgi:hypothetical protein
MHLKQSPRKNGRTYLSMVRSYRDKDKGYSRTETVESFGYVDELEKHYDDPVAHFQKFVDEKNLAEKQEAAEYTIKARKNKKLNQDIERRKNYGYIIIMKLLYELGLPGFLTNRQWRDSKIKYNTASIMKLLVISRILSPGSKKKAFEERDRYFDFEKDDAFDLMDVYRSLSFFAKLEKDIQLLMHDRVTKNYGRELDLIYYDVTNYYFEVDMEDDLRKKGVSKEHRPNPIVQMGLASDAEGLPISYEVFPGNESEKLHLRPAVFDLYSKYDAGRVIAVADSAQNTGNTLTPGNRGTCSAKAYEGRAPLSRLMSSTRAGTSGAATITSGSRGWNAGRYRSILTARTARRTRKKSWSTRGRSFFTAKNTPSARRPSARRR